MATNLQEYFNILKSNRKPKTLKNYFWHFNHFVIFLKSRNKILDTATSIDIRDYIATRSQWNTAIKIQFLNVINGFYRFYILKIPIGNSEAELRSCLTKQNIVKEILAIPFPAIVHRIQHKALSLIEVDKLLTYTKRHNYNDYCLIWILLYTGMRKGELLTISPIKHINWEQGYIHITTDISKTNRERIIPFDTYTKQILIHILIVFGTKQKLFNQAETYLNKMLAKYDKLINRHIFPHAFRHTFASEMIKSTKDKLDISSDYIIHILMGHSPRDITDLYTDYGDAPRQAMITFHYMKPMEM